MPLNAHEQKVLSIRLSEVITNEFGFSGPANADLLSRYEDKRMGQPHAGHGAPLGAVVGADAPRIVESGFLIAAETLLLRLDGAVGLLTTLLENAIGQIAAPEQPDAPTPAADKPKGRGGRPRKDAAPVQGEGQPATTNGGAAPSAGFPRKESDDPFGDPNQAPQEGDPFGVEETKPAPQQAPKEPEAPAQPALTDSQVKDALRAYMNHFGNEGTARLTDLLTRVAGVKRYSDLPASKWAAVVQASKVELQGK